jgi:hypothetical protein
MSPRRAFKHRDRSPGVQVQCESRVVCAEPLPAAFSVEEAGGVVRIRGKVSLCNRGWTLQASARVKRSELVVVIIAKREATARTLEIEDHEYVVTLRGLAPRRYRTRILHRWHLPEDGWNQAPLVAYEGTISVPAGPGTWLPGAGLFTIGLSLSNASWSIDWFASVIDWGGSLVG